MDIEIKNDNIFDFFNTQRPLIEITTFISVIAALFLQIDNPNNLDSLKMVQAIIASLMAGLITILLFRLWQSITKDKETPKSILLNGGIISAVIVFFLSNLYIYLWNVFNSQILFIFNTIKSAALFYLVISFEEFTSIKTKYKNMLGFISDLILSAVFGCLFLPAAFSYGMASAIGTIVMIIILFFASALFRYDKINSGLFKALYSLVLLGIFLFNIAFPIVYRYLMR